MKFQEAEHLERVTRIELVTEAWEAFVIPFHHTRVLSEDLRGVLRVVKRVLARIGPKQPRTEMRGFREIVVVLT